MIQSIYKFLIRFLGTTFYTGYSPVAPGTAGSLIALILVLVFPQILNWMPCLIPILFFLGVWISTQLEKKDGKDASLITIDEWCGMWISLLFVPLKPVWIPLAAFGFFRLYDIWKPFPINKSQNLSTGWGVMIDDVIAGIYSLLSMRILLYFL